MNTTIVKWGNSQGVRLPKTLLETAQLSENDLVELSVENNKIIIQKVTRKNHRTLKERIADHKESYTFEEWETGQAVGAEV